MKGFIEVTNELNEKVLLNINEIQAVFKNIILLVNTTEIELKESYEEIKELIKNAQ